MATEIKQNKACWYHVGPRPRIWRGGSFQAWMPGHIDYDTSALVLAVVVDANTGRTHVVPAEDVQFGANPKEMPNGQ